MYVSNIKSKHGGLKDTVVVSMISCKMENNVFCKSGVTGLVLRQGVISLRHYVYDQKPCWIIS